MFYTYVIRNKVRGKIYIGQTGNLDERLKRHNGILSSKKTSYTSKNSGVWEVIYTEVFKTRVEAIIREKQLKSSRGRDFIKQKIMVR